MTTGWYKGGRRPADSPVLGTPDPSNPTRTAQLMKCAAVDCPEFWIGYLPENQEEAAPEIASIVWHHYKAKHPGQEPH